MERPEVKTREDFVDYCHQLARSLRDDKRVFENADLVSFIDALGAWTEDMDGFYSNRGEAVPVQLSWEVMADMVSAALVYE